MDRDFLRSPDLSARPCHQRTSTVEPLEPRRLLSVAMEPDPAGDSEAARPPNFVFVLSDDQRWDALGVVQREQGSAARFPWLKTPNLDRIAEEGVRVRNAFVVSSLSSPARASFLSGQYAHQVGVQDNSTSLPTNVATYASELRAAGYETGYVGKWHMGGQAERPGYNYWASYLGQGTYFDATFSLNGRTQPTSGWVDDVATDYAIDYLKARKSDGKPFALTVGFKSPHVPRLSPSRLSGELVDVVSRPPPVAGVKAPYLASPGTGPGTVEQRDYFRTILGIDQNVGRLSSTLQELGLSNDTVLIFVGDNGYYLGEHGLGDKRSAYEESMRIPMLIRYPRGIAAGTTINKMILNVDVAPTILSLAGLSPPASMRGSSFVPLLPMPSESTDGIEAAVGWRTSAFYGYRQEAEYPQTPSVYAVRTETAKLIRYPVNAGWTELFDLSHDPYESRNLWSDPSAAALKQQMLAEFDRVSADVGFRFPEPPPPPPPPATSAIAVNFQPAGASTSVAGYHPDSGETYAARNGHSYGWSVSHTDLVFHRTGNANELLDTVVTVKAGARWELGVPNGTYTVKVSAGDPSFANVANVWVEGVSAIKFVSLAANSYVSKTVTVNVVDGRLTLGVGSAANLATRLNYVEVTPQGVPPPPPPPPPPPTGFTPVKINFQPGWAPTVAGYVVDGGGVYGARNGRTYGWSSSHAGVVYDRNKNTNQLLDTCVAVRAGQKWELAVPSGTYSVRIVAGDAGSVSKANVLVEGQTIFSNISLAANTFSDRSIRVTATDGRLTLSVGAAADLSTRIAWIEVSA